MNGPLYISIIEQTLFPFLKAVYPGGHCFMGDNDSKHISTAAQKFLVENDVSWWRTPAESPDCNPIENMWHELKEFIRREVKPTTKEELIDGVLAFWNSVDVDKCAAYTEHLRKILPEIIQLEGAATGY